MFSGMTERNNCSARANGSTVPLAGGLLNSALYTGNQQHVGLRIELIGQFFSIDVGSEVASSYLIIEFLFYFLQAFRACGFIPYGESVIASARHTTQCELFRFHLVILLLAFSCS